MLLQANTSEKIYRFQIIPLSDLPNGRIFFFIQVVGGGSLLLEKRFPGGVWERVKGAILPDELRRSICHTIDNTSATELWKYIMPLDEL